MIASIKGEITYKNESFLIIETGGIGFKVFCTNDTCIQAEIGSRTFLHIHMIVREDALQLYGFEKIEERDLFRQVISVSGIGPKLGISMLSTLTSDTIQRAVMHEQSEVFSRVPGIGDKTAKKIILMLKDKLETLLSEAGLDQLPDIDTDVIQALVSLGYSLSEAQKAVSSIPRETEENLEERLRIALKYFSS